MKFHQLLLVSFLLIASFSCKQNKNKQATTPVTAEAATKQKSFEVLELIQTSNYTYLRVYEGVSERWVAVSKVDAAKGDKFYYDSALEMKNFHSKELDRTFETVYFINKISKKPTSQQETTGKSAKSSKAKSAQNNAISLEKTKNELTIAQIFENPSEFRNKEIEIRGVVVKINKRVMGKNWIHIQDGTSHEGNYDLTVTSQELPETNEEVRLKGKVILNKDFGAGYFYAVIVEEGVILSE